MFFMLVGLAGLVYWMQCALTKTHEYRNKLTAIESEERLIRTRLHELGEEVEL